MFPMQDKHQGLEGVSKGTGGALWLGTRQGGRCVGRLISSVAFGEKQRYTRKKRFGNYSGVEGSIAPEEG